MTAAVFIARQVVVAAPTTGADGRPVPAPAPVQKPRSPQEIEALRQIVINALGLKPVAGQPLEALVSVQETEFQVAEQNSAQLEAVRANETSLQTYFELASRWVAIAGAAIVLFIFWRMLKRQKPEPVPIEVLSLTPDSGSRTLSNAGSVTPEMLNDLIRQKPANIGIALRDWVAAGNAPAGKN